MAEIDKGKTSMRWIGITLVVAGFLGATVGGAEQVDPEYRHASPEAVEAWRDMKYGLRIHWGVYSKLGLEASWPLARDHRNDLAWQGWYHNLYRTFNPVEFDAEDWADLMVRNGLKFFVFTTKHHDGFSMFATRTRVKRRFVYAGPNAGKIEACDLHYSVMETPYRKDIVGELIEACRNRGLGIGLYFSHIDWYDADFRLDEWNPLRDANYSKETDAEGWGRFVKRHREQIRELCTNYGKIDMISFDMHFPPGAWPDVKETVKMARRLQPDALFRHRGIGAYGDYQTPENWIPATAGQKDPRVNKPWQVIHVLGSIFAYDPNPQNYKSGEWIVSNLVDIVAKGGNFMVSIGPDANGTFHPVAIERLEYVGEWLKVNGQAIYKTRPWVTYKEGEGIRFTRSKDGKYVYAISLKWPGEMLKLNSVRPRTGSSIFLLGVEEPLRWRMDEHQRLIIEIPKNLQAEANRPCKQAYAFRIEGEPNSIVETPRPIFMGDASANEATVNGVAVAEHSLSRYAPEGTAAKTTAPKFIGEDRVRRHL